MQLRMVSQVRVGESDAREACSSPGRGVSRDVSGRSVSCAKALQCRPQRLVAGDCNLAGELAGRAARVSHPLAPTRFCTVTTLETIRC